MSSPFASFANATLRFQVASGNLEPDSKGNMRPSVAVVEVTALMEQARRPKVEPRAGVDTETASYLEGFAVAPMQLPGVVSPKNRCAAIWAGRQGEFFLEPVARSPWEYERVTGDELRGWFQPSNFTVEGEPWIPGSN